MRNRPRPLARPLRLEPLERRCLLCVVVDEMLSESKAISIPPDCNSSAIAYQTARSDGAVINVVSARLEEIWSRTVAPYLTDDLWTTDNAYDAGHHLMVPLHAAFEFGSAEWRQQFTDQFARFASRAEQLTTHRLNQLHYLYLASRFIILAESSGQPELIPAGLESFLVARVRQIWEAENADQWDQRFTGLRARMAYKLADTAPQYSYHISVRDDDLFVLAIAADLRQHERKLGVVTPNTAMLDEMLGVATTIFEREVVRTRDGGWLLQPGALTDHPDFAHASHEVLDVNLPPQPRPLGVEDSAHFHRLPLFLTSFQEAHAPGSPPERMFADLRAGLAHQFLGSVLTPPSSEFEFYRSRNYMDGHNGLYRYGGDTTLVGSGPHGTSSTMLYGWWAFVDSDAMRAAYRDMASRFPLSGNVLSFFESLKSSRQRHPLLDPVTTYHNGFRELMVALAGELGRDREPPYLVASVATGLAPRVVLTFNEPILLTAGNSAVEVRLADQSSLTPQSIAGAGTNQLVVELPALPADTAFEVLVHGNGTLVDRAGLALDGDADGIPGGDAVRAFSALSAGDRVTALVARGGEALEVSYELSTPGLGALEFNVYRSADAVLDLGDELLATRRIHAVTDVQPGRHSVEVGLGLDFPLPGAGLLDTEDDYVLLGHLAPVAPDPSEFTAGPPIPFSGVYRWGDGPLMVFGTSGPDSIHIDFSQQALDINGSASPITVDPSRPIRVRGLPGDDSLEVSGEVPANTTSDVIFFGGSGTDAAAWRSSGDDVMAHLQPTHAVVASARLRVEAHGVESQNVRGGGANDRVYFEGSSGFDQFYADGGWQAFRGPGFAHVVTEFEFSEVMGDAAVDRAYIHAAAGGSVEAALSQVTVHDGQQSVAAHHFARVHVYARPPASNATLRFVDSAASETLLATPWYAYLSSATAVVTAWGFSASTAAAGNGFDTALLFDSYGDDRFDANPAQASLQGNQFRHAVAGFDKVVAAARLGAGRDQAYLQDSAGVDTLNATPSYARLTGTGYLLEADYFDEVVASSTANPITDVANFYDSRDNDTLTSRPGAATLTNGSYRNEALGFESLNVFGGTGVDTATLTGSPGDDALRSTPTETTLSGPGYRSYTRGFDRVTTRAIQGGKDRAELHGSSGNDRVVGAPTYMFLTGAGFYLEADYFDEVTAQAIAGVDTASLHGSAAADRLTADPNVALLVGPGFSRQVVGFDQVVATAGPGTANDQATFYDSEQADDFSATASYGRLTGLGYALEADWFRSLHVVSRVDGPWDTVRFHSSPAADDIVADQGSIQFVSGQIQQVASGFESLFVHGGADASRDRVTLHDTPADDTFVATPGWAKLTAPRLVITVLGMPSILVRAGAGGIDRAELSGSAAWERFVATPMYAFLRGSNGDLEVDYFEQVVALGGGDEEAQLYDSAGDDLLVAQGLTAELRGPGYWNTVSRFGRVRADSSRAGEDRTNLAALDFVLGLTGSWM